MMEYGLLLFLAIGQGSKMFSDFEILTWESMGKSQKWNILKPPDGRVKRMKIWDWQSYEPHILILFMSAHLSSVWGSFGAFCAKFPMLRFSKATGPTVFIQFQPKFIVSMLVMREYRLLIFGDPTDT